MNDSIRRLGVVSRAYELAAQAFHGQATEAANAEADHKHARAVFMVRLRSEDPKISAAWAETQAEADGEVSAALLRRLTSAAVVDAAKQRLYQLREQVATGRTAVASERAADQIHASGTGGAA